MNKKLFLQLFALLSAFYLYSQQDNPVVLKIDGVPVYRSELESAYRKGNENAEKKQSIGEFTESYINFRLSVAEAKAERIDTTASYRRQFSSYRSQIAEPYMKSDGYEEEYVKKIYGRMLENVEINHVMIPFLNPEIVLPADTVEAYKKAVEARKKILKYGFEKAGFTTPKAGSAFIPGAESRNGYVGWVSPFMFAAKVEDAIYSLPLMEVSKPIRAARGYHIVQVINKRPAMGSAEVEQVLFNFSHIPANQHQIDSVGKVAQKEYESIKSPADFQSLCDLFTRARNTGDKGCYFGVIGLDSNLPMDFTMAAFNLRNPGDISKPVMSEYGFHILRLLKKIPVPDYETLREQLRTKIIRSDKVQELSNERRARLKENFDVKVNKEAYAKLLAIAETTSPRDSVFLTRITNTDEILFDIDGKRAYPVGEFAKYISYRQKERNRDNNDITIMQVEEASPYSLSTDVLNEYFEGFMSLLLSSFRNETLEKIYPDFEKRMNEISEGLLFSEIQEKNIWRRSKDDIAGLAACFALNKAKYTLDSPKYKGMIIYAKDKAILNRAEAVSKKEKTQDAFVARIRRTLNKDSIAVKIEPGTWGKGDNPYVDNKIYGGAEPKPFSGYPYFFVSGTFIDKPEDYTDVRTAVEADYEKQLEKEWVAYLRGKYKVEINKPELDSIK